MNELSKIGNGHPAQIDVDQTRDQILGEIQEADSVAKLKGITGKLSPLQEYARQAGESLEQINNFAEGRVMAMCKGGYLLRKLDKSKGGRPSENSPQAEGSFASPYRYEVVAAGLSEPTAERWQIMSWAWVPENLVTPYCHKQRGDGKTITAEDVYRLGKKAMPYDIEDLQPIEGKYSVVVIDPPWPMQRIERDVAPDQAGMDYPIMTEEEIARLGTDDEQIVPEMLDQDCHVFLWTTQKFYDMGRRLFERWGVKYILEMVWHKPGGFQPYNLPQYNCEFVLYGRKGAPEFIETKDFMCCFSALRREHSRKPDEFYETIARVTSGRRIDVFAREQRPGFDVWGNQANKFEEMPDVH